MKNNRLAKYAVGAALAAGAICSGSAGLIVDWSNPGVVSGGASGNIDISWGSIDNPTGNLQNFTGGSMSSALNADYVAQPFSVIGQTLGTVGAVPFETAYVRNDANSLDGYIWYGVQANEDTRNATGLFYFDAADFVGGGVSPGDTVSSMTLNLNQQRGETSRSRFVIKSGGSWYASDFNADGAGGTISGSFTYTAGLSGDWAAFSPASASSTSLMTGDGLTYSIDGATLNDIEAVGWFFEASVTGADGATPRARFRLEDFSVETVAVPEPHSLGLMTVVGGMLLLRRRCRG